MKKIGIFILLFIVLLMSACNKKKDIIKVFYLDEVFSIVPTITIIDEEDAFDGVKLVEELSNITKLLDEKFNVFNEKSLISKVNNEAWKKDVVVDDEFIKIMKTAIQIAEETKIENIALYDVTIYSIWKEWGFKDNYYIYNNYVNPPEHEIIRQKLPLVNIKNIIINEDFNSIYFTKEGVEIDLGSIVKGYAADLIYEKLKEYGFNNFIIDVGGNIVTSGRNSGTNNKWKVGITKPYSYNEEIGYVEVEDKKVTIVTSGIYERYIVSVDDEGKEHMYHHIINPVTGYPVENELLSVSIFGNESIKADAYSTAIYMMGLEKGMDYINSNEKIEAIFITKNKEVHISKGIKNFVVNKEIYKDNYKIINNLI